MYSIIYPRAGKIALAKYNADGTLPSPLTASNMIVGNGTVQSIGSTVTINTSELADGNSDWPMGVYDTGTTGQIAVTMSSFQPNLYAALTGATVEQLSSATLWAAEEERSIPSASPFTVNLDRAVKADGTIVIVTSDNSPFTKVATAPETGQFSIASNTITFNSTDAGKEVLITYEWTATQATKIGLPSAASRPALHCIISTLATDEDGIGTYDANIIVDKCKATGDIAQPTQQREVQTWNFTLRVLKPRGGYNPVYWSYAKRS